MMKTALFVLMVMLAVMVAGPGARAEEAGKKKGKEPAKEPAKGKVMHLPLKGTVVAITSRTLTLKGGEGKDDRKFAITKDTEIQKGNARAKSEDVKVGQEVTGSYVRAQDGPDVLTMLQLEPPPGK